jgi:hypothetical protein
MIQFHKLLVEDYFYKAVNKMKIKQLYSFLGNVFDDTCFPKIALKSIPHLNINNVDIDLIY